jgi:hypothetical protein
MEMSNTIIGDIRTAMRDYHSKLAAAKYSDGTPIPFYKLKLAAPQDALIERARQLFGSLNGWHAGSDVKSFTIKDIGKRSGSYGALLDTELFDHCIFYRSQGERRGQSKCAAIVTQPYRDFPVEVLQKLAAEYKVVCHVPPHPEASFWSPGSTNFYVFTMPEHRIVWLPEQLNGISDQPALSLLSG